jgi:uncharacterized protein YggT (Ycf19 family)
MEPIEPVQPVQPVQPVYPVEPVYPARRVRPGTPPNWGAWRAANFVYIIFGIIEALILIRFVLKLLAANPNAGFSSFIYNVTAPLVAPFQGVFPTPASNGSVLEIASLLAIVVYALISWAIVRLIELAQRPTTVA